MVFDSARWEGFVFRPDDIVISTPPKCGTTWTQMICALLVYQTTSFEQSLDLISPWLDMLTRDLASVRADLDAQTHRRFIKTHTPFDGLPHHPDVTYICVGRDPRDVFRSWENHRENMDILAVLAARERAVGLDDVMEMLAVGPPPLAETGGPRRRDARTGDTSRHRGRRVSLARPRRRGHVPQHARPGRRDRTRHDERDLDRQQRFFNRGCTGQWRDLLDDAAVRRYGRRVSELVASDLATWAHHGALGG